MTDTTIPRVTTRELNEIVQRLNTPLNDDGYRSWYSRDVTTLMQELMALRTDRERVRAALLQHPPLMNEDVAGLEVLALVHRLLDVVGAAAEGVWQRAEVKRIKGTLETLAQERDDYAGQLAEAQAMLNERVEHIAGLGRLISGQAAENAEQARAGENERARLIARLDGHQAEIADLKGQLQEAILVARTDQLRMAQEFDRREAELRANTDREVAVAKGEADEARRQMLRAQQQMQQTEERLAEVRAAMMTVLR